MKRSAIILLSMVAIIVCLCSCDSNSFAGSWYNTMDPDKELILTEDKSFSFNGNGGTYSVENDTLILNYNYGDSDIFTIESNDGVRSLYDEYGNQWLNDREAAVEIYNEYCNEKTAREKQLIVGDWYQNAERNSTLSINDDGTYVETKDSATSNGVERGTWIVEEDGEYTKIHFTVVDTTITTSVMGSKGVLKPGDEYYFTVYTEQTVYKNGEEYNCIKLSPGVGITPYYNFVVD